MNYVPVIVSASDALTDEAAKQPGVNRQNDQACENIISIESEVESTSRRVRSLREIYESCTFALVMSDPVTYEDVKDVPICRMAMQEELNSI